MPKNYNAILDAIEISINAAETREEKIHLITKSRSLSAFSDAFNGSTTLSEALTIPAKDEYDTTNALALAICLGQAKRVEKMLALLDEDSLNNEDNFVWGYRQPYSFLHLAAHPHAHIDATYIFRNQESYVDAQIAIIKLLGKHGANPNLVVKQQIYTNPALAVGEPMGHTFFPLDEHNRLRAALLLIGADPTYIGSSYRLGRRDFSLATDEAACQYILTPLNERIEVAGNVHGQVADKIATNLQHGYELLASRHNLSASNVTTASTPCPNENSNLAGNIALGLVAIHLTSTAFSWFKGKLFDKPVTPQKATGVGANPVPPKLNK